MKACSIVLQLVMLVQILESGLPVHLVWIFTSGLAATSFFSAVIIHSTRDRWVLGISLADALYGAESNLLVCLSWLAHHVFDAVCRRASSGLTSSMQSCSHSSSSPPALTCCTSIANSSHSTTRRSLRTALSDLTARLQATRPARVGLNWLLCYRSSRFIDIARHAKFTLGRLYPKRHPVALPFLFALLTVIFVIVSVNSARQACAPNPECTVHARRWVTLTGDTLTICPCLVMVAMERAPRSYDEWLSHPFSACS